MTESIPTTWNDERDAAFFGIAENLTAGGFTDSTALLADAVSAGADLTARIDTVLQDLIAAESWEAMATRCVARTTPHHRDLVPVPVVTRRPAAS